MTTPKTIVYITPHRQPSIPLYSLKYKKLHSHANVSEYQDVYKKWPWQKPRTNIRPQINTVQIGGQMKSDTVYKTDYAEPKLASREKWKIPKRKALSPQYKNLVDDVIKKEITERKSTYNTDYCQKEIQLRRPYSAAGEQSYKPPTGKFEGQSMYQLSYPSYSPEVMKSCRPNLIAPQSLIHSNYDRLKTELDIQLEPHVTEEAKASLGTNASKSNSKADNPETQVMKQNTTQMLQQNKAPEITEKKKSHENVSVQVPETPVVKDCDQSMMTTFMSDFKPNLNVPVRTPCRPVETNYRCVVTPFDGTTTQSTEYKAWPVSKPEVPTWAQKPAYKPPVEGMALTSTYTMDYADPKVIQIVAAMKRPIKNENIIRSDVPNPVFKPTTTYNSNFKDWKGAQPAKTYLVKSVYNPPKEKMECISTHRSYYKGEGTQKAQLIRHMSEHRQLNRDGKHSFNTTYQETYKDNRPKSCPGAVRGDALLGFCVKSAWEENNKKKLNESTDSGIDMIDCEEENKRKK